MDASGSVWQLVNPPDRQQAHTLLVRLSFADRGTQARSSAYLTPLPIILLSPFTSTTWVVAGVNRFTDPVGLSRNARGGS